MKPLAGFAIAVAGLLALGGTARLTSAAAGGGDTPGPPPAAPPSDDAALVKQLLGEKLGDRHFSFATVAQACSGKAVLPLRPADPVHARVIAAIDKALKETLAEMNGDASPVRSLRRINEASRFFEDSLHRRLDAEPDLSCGVPPNRLGKAQRSGYPDLRIVHEPEGTVFYLDPKLVEDGSWRSTLRAFYFEPKDATLKITDDAVHLLAGIGHDGHEGAWKFTRHELVDLSTLQVRLKAEFQASNAEVYSRQRQPGDEPAAAEPADPESP